jgi:Cu/Ag efflux protein CusF
MTMEFRLPEPSKMPAQSLRIGDQIEIEFQMQEGDIPQVIQIQPSNSGMKQSGGKQ